MTQYKGIKEGLGAIAPEEFNDNGGGVAEGNGCKEYLGDRSVKGLYWAIMSIVKSSLRQWSQGIT